MRRIVGTTGAILVARCILRYRPPRRGLTDSARCLGGGGKGGRLPRWELHDVVRTPRCGPLAGKQSPRKATDEGEGLGELSAVGRGVSRVRLEAEEDVGLAELVRPGDVKVRFEFEDAEVTHVLDYPAW